MLNETKILKMVSSESGTTSLAQAVFSNETVFNDKIISEIFSFI